MDSLFLSTIVAVECIALLGMEFVFYIQRSIIVRRHLQANRVLEISAKPCYRKVLKELRNAIPRLKWN